MPGKGEGGSKTIHRFAVPQDWLVATKKIYSIFRYFLYLFMLQGVVWQRGQGFSERLYCTYLSLMHSK